MEQQEKAVQAAVRTPISKRMKLFVLFAALMIVMSALSTWLVYASFKNNYKEIQSQYYGIVTGQIVTSVEDTLRYGKELERYYGMDTLLGQMYAYLPQAMRIGVYGKTGALLSALDAAHIPDAAQNSDMLQNMIQSEKKNEMLSIKRENGDIAYGFPIFGPDGSVAGGILMTLEDSAFTQALNERFEKTLQISIVIVSASLLLLLLVAIFAPFQSKKEKSRISPALIGCMAALVLCIGASGVFGYTEMENEYTSTMVECAESISGYMGGIVQQVRAKGVGYDQMQGLSSFLAARVSKTNLIWNMKLLQTLATTDNILQRPEQSIYIGTTSALDEVDVFVQFELSEGYVSSMLTQLFLTFFVTLILMLFIMGEVNKLPKLWVGKDGGEKKNGQLSIKLRLVTFLLFTANYLSIPYCASMVLALNSTVFGLSLATAASFPLAAETFSMMLSMLLLHKLTRGLSNRTVSILSVTLLLTGSALSFLCASTLQLIGARMLCGVGSGMFRVFINRAAALQDKEQVEKTLAATNAGLLGGIMCGGALGAVISSMLGNRMTFLCTFFVLLLAGLLLQALLDKNTARLRDIREKNTKSAWGILRSPRFLLFFLTVLLPFNIGLMFIVSFLPAYVRSVDTSGLIASYAYIVNGISGIYIGGMLGKWVSRRLRERGALLVMMGMAVLAVLSLLSGLPFVSAALLASALFGMFDVYGNPAITGAYLRLPSVLGKDLTGALTIMSVLGALVQTSSPMLYNILIGGMELHGAAAALVPVLAFLMICAFAIFALHKQKAEASVVRGDISA